MEIQVRFTKNPDSGIRLAKFGRRHMMLMKNEQGDNLIIMKSLHSLENSEMLESQIKIHPHYFESVVKTRFGYITEKVILMSDEAIEILNILKSQQ